MSDLDKYFEEVAAQNAADYDRRENDPKAKAAREAKQKEEFDRGVRLGWWDDEGNPLQQNDDDCNDDD